jgi:hypothetical protein
MTVIDRNALKQQSHAKMPRAAFRRGDSALDGDTLRYHNGEKIVEVFVGSGATCGIGSDRFALTVVEIISAKRVILQTDESKRLDDNGAFTESQKYEFRRDDNGSKVEVSLRKNGTWITVGSSLGDSYRYHLGHRAAYHDPCF